MGPPLARVQRQGRFVPCQTFSRLVALGHRAFPQRAAEVWGRNLSPMIWGAFTPPPLQLRVAIAAPNDKHVTCCLVQNLAPTLCNVGFDPTFTSCMRSVLSQCLLYPHHWAPRQGAALEVACFPPPGTQPREAGCLHHHRTMTSTIVCPNFALVGVSRRTAWSS